MTDRPTGEWYVRLDDGREFLFKHGQQGENPLEAHSEWFDRDGSWSLDVPELQEEYPPDHRDNSFVLVPKEEVAAVFFRRYGDDDEMDPQRTVEY